MSEYELITPVAFIIFNRPDTTKRVFEEIRRAKPQKLLVIADGPRSEKEGEADKCAEARAIIDTVDWECEVLKNYSDVNLGCKYRVSSGLDWVFNNVEEAIILEDDCLPHPSFFRFCQELLDKYRNNNNVMMVSGDNFQFGKNKTKYSYYYSRHNHIWGWATWRRAWKYYDVEMQEWQVSKEKNIIRKYFDKPEDVHYWEKIFNRTYEGKIDTWDYQWTYACWLNNGLTILPNINLVSNIGFGEEATHTKESSRLSNMQIEEIKFPLKYPKDIERNKIADDYTQSMIYCTALLRRITDRVRRFIRHFL